MAAKSSPADFFWVLCQEGQKSINFDSILVKLQFYASKSGSMALKMVILPVSVASLALKMIKNAYFLSHVSVWRSKLSFYQNPWPV